MTIYKELNDYELLYMISENNEEAYSMMLSKYRHLVYKYADHYLKKYAGFGIEREELVQEGVLGLLNAIASYVNQDKCLFYTFASIVIRREMERYIKTMTRNKQLILTTASSLSTCIMKDELLLEDTIYSVADNVERIVDDNFYSRLLYEFKFELSDLQAQVYELRLNNFSNSEISQLLDMTYKSVDNCIRLMKQKFKIYVQSKI